MMNKLNYSIGLFVALFVLSSCGPTSRFTYEQAEKKAPAPIEFTNDSKKAETFEWDFGDGNSSTDENPSHSYYLSGTYDVKLTAKKGSQKRTSVQKVYVDAPDICLVVIETDFGNMFVELFEETPKHRDNFIKLAEEGFYDDLLFHRVIEGFMVQGGDPTSKNAKAGKPLGTGGPPYQIDAEINKNLVHVRGALAAARQPDNVNPKKKSSGSQFYIVHGKKFSEEQLNNFALMNGAEYSEEQRKIIMEQGGYPPLDMEYTVFGQVVSGLEIVDAIAKVRKDKRNRPMEDLKMKIRVIK